MSHEIHAAAAALAEAQVTATSAVAVLTAALSARKEVTDRIAALDAARAAIIGARRRSVDHPDHGGRLALIDADRQTLLEIDTERAAKVATAQGAATSARQAVSRAEQHLAMARDEELLRRLVEHCGKLDAVLVETVRELATVTSRVGGRPRWAPCRELARELQRLRLVADGLAVP